MLLQELHHHQGLQELQERQVPGPTSAQSLCRQGEVLQAVEALQAACQGPAQAFQEAEEEPS